MTTILGISAFYHDSAATLVIDGEIVCAAQEERFTRKKHDHEFPKQAIDFCLRFAGLKAEQLDYVGFYDKPVTKFERLIETYIAFAPAGYRSFRQALPLWLKQKLHVPREIRQGIVGFNKRIVFLDHHQSHAASAYYPSPFDEAAILTLDGVGEWSTSCIGHGQNNKLKLLQEIRFPHSLGLLYSAFTYYTGFRVNSGEYKLMGLAPYGEPNFKQQILEHLVDLKSDGSLRMDMSYFNYCQGLTMTGPKFHRLFGGPPRLPESKLTQRDMDLAASVQAVTEEVMLRMARHAHDITGSKNLVLAGGVALNCVGNGRILSESPFDNIWIQPAAGDAGGALGTALFVWNQLLDRPRKANPGDSQKGSLLGPDFTDDAIRNTLEGQNAVFQVCSSEEQICDKVAKLIASEHVVGWHQGRMEFGPRALGARSILGDARSPKMQSVMNLKIKFRESFRPFAPVVLLEHASEYFELKPNVESPYMLLVAPVRKERRTNSAEGEENVFGIKKLNLRRSEIPAVTHVDYSARIQTVDSIRNPLLHRMLGRFYQLTGCPVMINTSFNVRSEPIVCTPSDAYRCFMMTDMDALAIGKFLLLKSEQPMPDDPKQREEYLRQFELD
ncbi:MAG TPA: carbamoyltransferase [Pirellula sp.]|nr:carbamoyltransferase [Pirellula sp.]